MSNENELNDGKESACDVLLAPVHQTAIVFACRYCHNRETGATYAVTRALSLLWGNLSLRVQEQIEREARDEATTNWDDWADFFDWKASESSPAAETEPTEL